MGQTSNLKGGWETFWSGLTGASGADRFFLILGIVAAVVLVCVLISLLWSKAAGRGKRASDFGWWIVVCGILAAPNLLIPWALGLVDLIVNLASGGLTTV